MPARRLLLAILAATVLFAATGAHAFDDQRRGFILGFGLGAGSARQSVETTGNGLDLSASGNTGGLATDFRIGGGLSDQWLLHYTSQQLFFDGDLGSGGIFAQGFVGAAATYYLRPQAPSLLLEFGLGFGSLVDLDERESDTGFGVLLGVGYEFARHWQVEASWSGAQLGEDEFLGVEMEASIGTFRVTVGWLGY